MPQRIQSAFEQDGIPLSRTLEIESYSGRKLQVYDPSRPDLIESRSPYSLLWFPVVRASDFLKLDAETDGRYSIALSSMIGRAHEL